MSTNQSTTNQSYKHLSEAERGKIEAYLRVGLKPAEITRRLGKNRSTITREINRGSITQLKKVNGQKVYYQLYYSDAAHNRYRDARETKGAQRGYLCSYLQTPTCRCSCSFNQDAL